jgi:hypothetical protein
VTDAGSLIVGYGNSLRSDDGVGWHTAGLLAGDPRLAGARVLARHQLLPELAADVGRASLVVLVDAATQGAPGSVAGPAGRATVGHPGQLVASAPPGAPGWPGRGPLRPGAPDRAGERGRRVLRRG